MTPAFMLWFNYAIIVQFGLMAIGWSLAGDLKAGMYWFGAFLINLAVTLK